jgi:Fe-S oxidoreductase
VADGASLLSQLKRDLDAVIAATGTSCRQQIFHGTERDAWHPVQLVREALFIR